MTTRPSKEKRLQYGARSHPLTDDRHRYHDRQTGDRKVSSQEKSLQNSKIYIRKTYDYMSYPRMIKRQRCWFDFQTRRITMTSFPDQRWSQRHLGTGPRQDNVLRCPRMTTNILHLPYHEELNTKTKKAPQRLYGTRAYERTDQRPTKTFRRKWCHSILKRYDQKTLYRSDKHSQEINQFQTRTSGSIEQVDRFNS